MGSEPRNKLFNHGFGFGLDLPAGLILDRVGDVDRIEVGTSQRGGLSASRRHELVRGNGNGADSKTFQLNRVVQTARCTGPSIGESLDYRVGGSQPFENGGGSGLGVRRLLIADYVCDMIPVLQQTLHAIQKNTSAGLRDIEEGDGLAFQSIEPGRRNTFQGRGIVHRTNQCERHLLHRIRCESGPRGIA